VRALVEGLETPHPLGLALPALYQDDDFAQRFLAALDEVVAPILCTLDNLDAYFDPSLAPDDFVAWLASWVGLVLDDNWPMERRRALVDRAAELYSWRGTVYGLTEHVAIYTGATPEVEDSGGCEWSPEPGADPPGTTEHRVTVRVRIKDGEHVDQARLDAIVRAAKPAHVVHEIEVVKE
jgi:phage tail-like protein